MNLKLVACLFVAWALVYFCIWKGIRTTGKVVYVTATLPYVFLIILFIRALTLPGSSSGMVYYVTPVWSRLADPKVNHFLRSASPFVHLEKFGLRFPKSFLWIFFNLLHSWPSLDLHGCFNIHEGLGMANNMRLNEVKWGLICVSSIRPFLTFRHRPFTSISSWVRYSNSLVTGFWP